MCHLKPTPEDLDCDFRGKTGDKAVLAPKGDSPCVILFGAVKYGEKQIVQPGNSADKVEIEIQAGRIECRNQNESACGLRAIRRPK